MSSLRLGVVVDNSDKLYYLKAAAFESGHEVVQTLIVNDESALHMPDVRVDAWIADLALPDAPSSGVSLADILVGLEMPIVFCDSSELAEDRTEREIWLKCLKLRLKRLGGDVSLIEGKGAEHIWILAASTGGVAAVKEFLQYLPSGLGIGFLYAQHIDEGYSSVLANLVNKTGAYPAILAATGTVIARDTVTVIDPVHRVEVLENATLLVHDEPWNGPYQPSINQLTANVARTLRSPSGLIVFSGMGDDGGLSSRLIKQRKGQVWAQSPESCVIASMPEAVLDFGCVDRTGTPRELAIALAEFMGETTILNQGVAGS